MTSLPLTLSYDNLVTTNKHTVTTTSKIVADSFEKLHKDVLRKIEQLSFETPMDWYKRNFTPIQIATDLGQNRSRLDKAYEMSKDGFMLLVMGFTGKKAMALKIRFIEAFNWAFEQIQRTTSHQRDVLIRACEKLSVGKMSRPQAYALVANEFGYEKPIDIPVELIPEATAFAYETLLRLKTTETVTPIQSEHAEDIKHLISHVFTMRSWVKAIRQPLEMLNPNLIREINGTTAWNSEIARILNKRMDLGVDTKLMDKEWGQKFLNVQ